MGSEQNTTDQQQPRIPHFGWRSVFVVGMLPVILAIFILKKVPESPRWLSVHRHQEPKNEKLLPSVSEEQSVADRQLKQVPLTVLLRPPYLKRLVLTANVLFFGYYGVALWLPSILTLKFKMGLAKALSYTMLVGVFAIPGKLTAFFTIDRFGRKQLFYAGFGMSILISLLFGVLTHPIHLLAGACALSFFLEEAAAGCVVLPTELFPSQGRATANSLSSAAGKLAAALSPMLFEFAMARQWYYGIFLTMAVFFAVACVMVFALGRLLPGRSIKYAASKQSIFTLGL